MKVDTWPFSDPEDNMSIFKFTGFMVYVGPAGIDRYKYLIMKEDSQGSVDEIIVDSQGVKILKPNVGYSVELSCYKVDLANSNSLFYPINIKVIGKNKEDSSTGTLVAIEGILKHIFSDFFVASGIGSDDFKIFHLYLDPSVCESTLLPLVGEEVSIVGRYDPVYKNRFHVFDIMPAKEHSVLTKKNPKSTELKKEQKDYDFYRFNIELD